MIEATKMTTKESDQLVLGVEAIEGTDGLIERTGKLCPRGGFSLIKIAKPNQDMRFDVPTIGPQTVEMVRDGKGKVIAIEADQVASSGACCIDRTLTSHARLVCGPLGDRNSRRSRRRFRVLDEKNIAPTAAAASYFSTV